MTKSKTCEFNGYDNCEEEAHFVDETFQKVGRYEIREIERCDGSCLVYINGKPCKPEITFMEAFRACFQEQAKANAARKVTA